MKRKEEIWDAWVTYGEDGFVNGIRSDAPENVKEAYAKYMAEREQEAKNGFITK